MKILLIATTEYEPNRNKRVFNYYPPLGILYIATVLEEDGFQAKVIDLGVQRVSKTEFKKQVVDYSPQLVGVGMYTPTYTCAMDVIGTIKSVLPEVPIWLGGPHPSFTHEQILRDHKEVEGIVFYEGEQTMLEIARAYRSRDEEDIVNISGIAIRDKNGGILRTAPRERIDALDALPIPRRDFVDLDLYSSPFSLITARGCPSNCVFCSSRAFWGRNVVSRSAEHIYRELEYLTSNYQVNEFTFADDTFTASRERVFRFCHMLRNAVFAVHWICLARVDEIDEELLCLMRESGCRRVKFGIESASDEILRRIGKKITVRQIEDAVKNIRKHKMLPMGSIILGLPQDTIKTMRETIDFAVSLKEKYGVAMNVAVNTPFPGTPQFEKAEALGLSIHSHNWDLYDLRHPLVSTSNFTIDQLSELFCEAIQRLW